MTTSPENSNLRANFSAETFLRPSLRAANRTSSIAFRRGLRNFNADGG